MKDNVRNELKNYAETLSEECRRFMRESEKAAYFVEDLYAYRHLYDLSLKGMDSRYSRHGETYYRIEEEKQWIVAATGAVPVGDRIKEELRLLENAKKKFGDVFAGLRYCDEFWFFSLESVCAGWVEYTYIAENLPDKLDLTQLYAAGVTRWNWFAIVDPANNPERQGEWSPFPCVDLYGQWVFAYDVPVYVDENFKGVVAPHAKIEYMLNESIHRSRQKMLVVHDDSTLIGVNAAAKQAFPVEGYAFHAWDDHAEKISYVRNELNLMNSNSQDIVRLADGIKWQREFETSIQGRNYVVLKERIPEIRCCLVACLEKD